VGDRTVKVSLLLQAQGYMQGMREVGKATDDFGSKAEQLAAKKQGFESLGRAAVGLGATMALGVGVAISKWAEFDQQMSYVQAATHETAANMHLLKEAALEAGARTVYSATEAAGAIEELARAGVATEDILSGGLDAALDLAAAGGLEVADAAGIAAVALKTFNLQGQDMSHVADLLAAGAGKAMGDVSQLSQALSQGGQVAKQTGLSIEETTAGLAAFASQGLLGSDAGTSFKSMLQRLTPQSNEAAKKMEELGVSAYDASGNFIGLAEFAGNLQGALKSLTPEQRNSAMATIFGSDAVRAATVLYDEGEAGIRDWIDAVDDQGYAAETAAMRLDNLVGDWEAFTGALDTAFITMGAGTDGPLRGLVQGLTGLVDGFNDLPDGAQQAVMWVGLVTAGVALAGGTALLAVPKIAAFQVGMQTLGITAASTRAGLGRVASFLGGPWGIAMFAAATAVGLFNKQIEDGVPAQAEILNAIKTSTSAAEGFTAAFSRGSLETFFAGDYANELKDLPGLLDHATAAQSNWADALSTSFGQQGAYDSIKRYGDALGEMAGSDLPNAQKAFRELSEEYELNEAQTRRLLEEMPAYRDALLGVADKQGIAKDSAEFLALAMGKSETGAVSAAEAYSEQAEAVEELNAQVTELINQINAANGVNQDAISANADYQAALAGLTDQVEKMGASLDENTVAGSANADALSGVARSAQEAAAAQFEVDRTTMSAEDAAQKYYDTLVAQRQAFIDSAVAAGYNADEVHALADRIFQLPPERTVTIIAATAGARSAIDGLINDYNGRKIRIDLAINRGASDAELAGIAGIGYTPPQNATGNLYSKGKKVTAFAAGGTTSHIARATPGGLLKYAEAGWDESIITMNPAYRDRSLDIWAETGQRLGAWQPAPPSYAAAAAPQRASAGNSYQFGDIYGLDPAQIVGELNKEVRRAMAMSGINEGVSD
jgi:TP901 family phage tail tape measure protein